MASKAQTEQEQTVQVVEADVFDRMNETKELIAQRAYEIYQSRGGEHGSDQDDWFAAEGELLPKLVVDYDVTDTVVQVTAQVPGFDAKDLEVEVGHRQVVICGVHTNSNQRGDGHRSDKKVMRILDLPYEVDPELAVATLRNGTLQVVLPRSRNDTLSSY